jgi:hypothetical protein
LEARAGRAGGDGARQQLEAPPLPEGYEYLALWFNDLHKRRQAGTNGPQPLGWPDLDAWARRTGREPTPWELRVLTMLDDAYFAKADPVSVPVADRAWPTPKDKH